LGGKKKKDKQLERFEKMAGEDEETKRLELAKTLNVRERLMRRLNYKVIEIPFEDDLGPFNLKCRTLTEREQRKVIQVQTSLVNITTLEKYEEVMEQLYSILAYPSGVCVDESLDVKFWKSGNFSSELPLQILLEVADKTRERLTETRSFRKK